MPVIRLTVHSLWNRRMTALLTIFAIAVSVALLLSVQRMRTTAREGFASTVSGMDLIVGSRGGSINLLLYSVFHVGETTTEVSWASYQKIARHPDVAWTIPISLGDSHRGYRVLGTNTEYFEHYHFAGNRNLDFETGKPFQGLYETVLGSEVARSLGYRLGDKVVVAHGLGAVSFLEHTANPFLVVGILRPTGTPVDRTVHVSLEAITAIHDQRPVRTQSDTGAQPGSPETPRPDLAPTSITAFFVGMKSRVRTLTMQRAINDYPHEPLLAIVPGVALEQLWSLVGIADQALLSISVAVVLAGLLGMLTAILTSLNERRREMAILRSMGARPRHVFGLMVTEAAVLATLGVVTGVALSFAVLAVVRPILERRFGIFLSSGGLGATDAMIMASIVVAALLMGLAPAWLAYRNSLSDGLSPRL